MGSTLLIELADEYSRMFQPETAGFGSEMSYKTEHHS